MKLVSKPLWVLPASFSFLYMAFSDIKVTRKKIDAFEGSTLKRHSANTILGISDDDPVKHEAARTEVKLDLFDGASKLFFQDDKYSTKEDLLDAMESVDDSEMIQNLMVFKFLEFLFGDKTVNVEGGQDKAVLYERKYNHQLPKVITSLLADLDSPTNQNRPRFTR